MSLTLTLIPFECDRDSGSALDMSFSLLRCADGRDLLEAIMAVEKTGGEPVPRQFRTHRGKQFGECFGPTPKTAYGERMNYLTAEMLIPFKSHPEAKDNYLNRAVFAYLGKLPKQTKVALYWS